MQFLTLVAEHAPVVLQNMTRLRKRKTCKRIFCINSAGITHRLRPAVNLLKGSDWHRAATTKEPVWSASNRLIVFASRPAMIVTGAMIHELKHLARTGNFKVSNLPKCSAGDVTPSHRLTHSSEPRWGENATIIHIRDPIVLGVAESSVTSI